MEPSRASEKLCFLEFSDIFGISYNILEFSGTFLNFLEFFRTLKKKKKNSKNSQIYLKWVLGER
jgi:hypothetical protein